MFCFYLLSIVLISYILTFPFSYLFSQTKLFLFFDDIVVLVLKLGCCRCVQSVHRRGLIFYVGEDYWKNEVFS